VKDRLARRRRKQWQQERDENELACMIYEVFGHKCNAAATYMSTLGSGSETIDNVAKNRKLSVRTIQRHMEIAISVGLAFKNGRDIELREPTRELLLGMIPKERQEIHGWVSDGQGSNRQRAGGR
jgi:hypothetical protein